MLIVGCGARLIADGDILVYADLARWEAQMRFRRNEPAISGVENRTLAAGLQYKRAFFVDWRVCDRWKRPLIARWDFVLDTNNPRRAEAGRRRGRAARPAARGDAAIPRRALLRSRAVGRPMDEGSLRPRPAVANYGWCFDCVPEENSLLLGFGDMRASRFPSIDLVFDQPRALLGDAVHARFGDEFPIRFDFLDTMGGGNLSFQVHPLTEYIQQHFGMHYTQDESYYMLDAGPDASVYLGLERAWIRRRWCAIWSGAGRRRRLSRRNVREPLAGEEARPFPDSRRARCIARARTRMVLEISATPYIFTFKLWDWGRLGLDGKPRPIHLDHGAANIQWDRDDGLGAANLVNRVEPLASGDGWREERTGLARTRVHRDAPALVHRARAARHRRRRERAEPRGRRGSGRGKPDGAFEPFVVHYAEPSSFRPASGGTRSGPVARREAGRAERSRPSSGRS